MKKTLATMLSVTIAVLLIGFGALDNAAADDGCKAAKFDTQLTKDACAKGGQKEAKKAWQKWMKDNKDAYKAKAGKSMTCKTCHTKTSGDYALTADGLKIYKEYGGK